MVFDDSVFDATGVSVGMRTLFIDRCSGCRRLNMENLGVSLGRARPEASEIYSNGVRLIRRDATPNLEMWRYQVAERSCLL